MWWTFRISLRIHLLGLQLLLQCSVGCHSHKFVSCEKKKRRPSLPWIFLLHSFWQSLQWMGTFCSNTRVYFWLYMYLLCVRCVDNNIVVTLCTVQLRFLFHFSSLLHHDSNSCRFICCESTCFAQSKLASGWSLVQGIFRWQSLCYGECCWPNSCGKVTMIAIVICLCQNLFSINLPLVWAQMSASFTSRLGFSLSKRKMKSFCRLAMHLGKAMSFNGAIDLVACVCRLVDVSFQREGQAQYSAVSHSPVSCPWQSSQALLCILQSFR